ncbi:MAG TPA: SGNH/GDSL hydrolase family protein [Polyangia bacterium]|jgi:lysophospholipase L1-like esterase|nr:SGNH/GDSL hydrolase family protein [Polyangia bacterium]
MGGASATGGSTANGATGGVTATGGQVGAAGMSATGGAGGLGGMATSGGPTGGGGAAGSGGARGSGGTSPTGEGSGGAGGNRAGTGGIAGAAGVMGGSAGSGEMTGSGGAAGGSASTPSVRIVGRTEPGATDGSTEYSWPGVNIQARFTGTAVSMAVNNATGDNRITVVVDGGTAKVIALTSGQSTVSLASGLTSGPHDILIWRNTEASPGGTTTFGGLTGFGTGGTLLPPAAAPARRIEVVGDSLSVGAGVGGDSTCTGGIDAYTDNYLAYGSVAARAVSADVVTIAYSGIGVYRNYGETTPTAASLTMPKRYPYALPDTVLWNFALYQPQVVIINLGTNDFGSGDPGTPYETAYVSFVEAVRQNYADAYFILIDMYGGSRLTRLNDVLASLKAGGESRVEVLSLESVQNNLGCNQHPNVAGQQAMGTTLAARLQTLMGW